jgi:hypothetical protein
MLCDVLCDAMIAPLLTDYLQSSSYRIYGSTDIGAIATPSEAEDAFSRINPIVSSDRIDFAAGISPGMDISGSTGKSAMAADVSTQAIHSSEDDYRSQRSGFSDR